MPTTTNRFPNLARPSLVPDAPEDKIGRDSISKPFTVVESDPFRSARDAPSPPLVEKRK